MRNDAFVNHREDKVKQMRTSLSKVAFCAVVGLFLSAPDKAQALAFYNTESLFLGAATIESNENFDAYTGNYGFITPVISLDAVSYSASSCTNRCWTFDGNNVSPSNSLISNDIANNTLSFGSGRYVTTLGFWLGGLSGSAGDLFLGWEIVVNEKNGSSTVIGIPKGDANTRYFGFISESGIDSLLVRDNPLDGGASNWWFDNVARGAIIGGDPLPDSIPVPPPGLGGPNGPINGVPEPSTHVLVILGFLLLALSIKRRRVENTHAFHRRTVRMPQQCPP